MQIDVRHTTTYRYGQTARYSIQSLRLTPLNFDGQRVLSWSIEAPGIKSAVHFTDSFGNLVHLISIAADHDHVEIRAAGVVETDDTMGVVRGLTEPSQLRVYLRQTPMTIADPAIEALARSCAHRSILDQLHALMKAVHNAVVYETGATHVHTNAAEALAAGRGVCQDHAHIFISAARVLAVPARYVNGYFLSGTLSPADAHHAWAEAWVEGLGWVGFDPANLVCPTERYVRLASGLDAAFAAPIRGTRRGGEKEALDVVVEVNQQVAGQQ